MCPKPRRTSRAAGPSGLNNRILPNVLVVDDSDTERAAFAQLVLGWGYPVAQARSATEAIEMIQRRGIQLVIMDWQMPSMQGTELCTRLRRLNLAKYVYIILTSERGDKEFLIQALDSGADDVLHKPVDPNELEARLQSAVRRIDLQSQLARQTQDLAQAHELIAQDLRAVSTLQRSFLPDPHCSLAQVNYQWLSVPSKYVSGDHLQVFELAPARYGFYLLDVSGHGIPAAVKSMQLVQMFSDTSATSILYEPGADRSLPQAVSRPRDVVARLNALFQQTDTDLSYFTMIYGVYHAENNTVDLCQAGHPSPLVLRGNGQAETLGQGGYPVGLFEFDDYEDIHLSLGTGDALMLYSDGVTEVMNPLAEAYGEERLLRFINRELSVNRKLSTLPDNLQLEIQRFGGPAVLNKGFEDDVSILLLAPKPGPLDSALAVESSPALPDLVFRLQELQPSAVPTPQAAGKSIVIVDDSRSFLHIFQAMLSSWGYQVHTAKNGHEALKVIEQVQPDFVLTDWDMPGMTGIELCEQVRSQKQNAYIYIIMITGYATRDDLLQSLRVGADDFLTKPVSPDELKVRLRTAERIAELHMRLEMRHSELTMLYEALQRDMREVSRIQRSLLPKQKSEPWPCSLQTLYQPQGFVCGKQMGLLPGQGNEHGFFMVAMPGSDTSTALQAMALSRWLSISKATDVLFPLEPASNKRRRTLANPAQVLAEVSLLTPNLAGHDRAYDLLYGLLNTDHGTLMVACVGAWQMAVAQPGKGFELFESLPGQPGQVLFRGVVLPGSRLFFSSLECAGALDLRQPEAWNNEVLSKQRNGNLLLSEFPQVLARTQNNRSERVDLSLLAMQWREAFDTRMLEIAPPVRQALADEIESLASSLQDRLTSYRAPVHLGDFLESLAFEAVCDTGSIGMISRAVRNFVEGLAYSEEASYNVDLAVSEALTNVMIHGFKSGKPASTRIFLLAYQHAVAVCIDDQGECIPDEALARIGQVKVFDANARLSELPEGGMGLTFMRLVSQRFSYQSGPEGNRLCLII